MPTYLTPGVYVEEVPSASKPIEGVGTSIAAFVGLAPGGPVNTPMRISNWTQFAKIFGDPNEPDNGPFMEGAYLAHAVYGFFQNGGGLCWVVRVGAGGRRRREAAWRRCRPRPTSPSRPSRPRRSRASNGATVKVEITEEPDAGGDDGAADPTYKLVVDAGTAGKEEYEGLTLKKGRQNLATKVNAASKFIKITETGGLPGRAPRRRAPTRSRRRVVRGRRQGDRLRGRRRPAQGHGRPGRGRRDHDGLHAGRDDARRQRRRRRSCATSRAR